MSCFRPKCLVRQLYLMLTPAAPSLPRCQDLAFQPPALQWGPQHPQCCCCRRHQPFAPHLFLDCCQDESGSGRKQPWGRRGSGAGRGWTSTKEGVEEGQHPCKKCPLLWASSSLNPPDPPTSCGLCWKERPSGDAQRTLFLDAGICFRKTFWGGKDGPRASRICAKERQIYMGRGFTSRTWPFSAQLGPGTLQVKPTLPHFPGLCLLHLVSTGPPFKVGALSWGGLKFF